MHMENEIATVSHFHYYTLCTTVGHAKLEAACMERVTLKYEASSPLYTLCPFFRGGPPLWGLQILRSYHSQKGGISLSRNLNHGASSHPSGDLDCGTPYNQWSLEETRRIPHPGRRNLAVLT